MTKPAPATSAPEQVATARPKLDDEAFEAFIREQRPVPPVWSMSGLDGYLTALIIGPKFINPYVWIPLFAGEGAMASPMETTEHQAVQTLVAEYNRISATLAESPKEFRPRFNKLDAHSYDGAEWYRGFLIGTRFAERTWRPVLRGDPITGDIIAPIRARAYATTNALTVELVLIADAISKIRDYFMPRRAKQKF
ncbi:UPF0149 family protein (plasmid) [Agrobacterium leguminum]|uniref:UPF0149 family protein n=1 Tax=Agrobacterium leguminum TaxID=2792015 RepID=UPI00272C76DA|nr:UPF0149 family protein [Agrobacterium leguminum]WLE00802.1 UPF0149 family protein [Agrobacterium leguminum]